MKIKKSNIIDILSAQRKADGGYKLYQYAVPEIKYVDLDCVMLEDQQFESDSWVYTQILKLLKIPKSLYSKMDSKLRFKLIKHQTSLLSENKVQVRFKEDSVVTAILSSDYSECRTEELIVNLPDWDCIEHTQDINAQVQNFRFISGENVLPEGHFVGFDLSLSEVGGWPLMVNALVYVQVCTNGLMRLRDMGKPYFKVPMDQMDGVQFQAIGAVLAQRMLDVQELSLLNQNFDNSKEAKINLSEEIQMWYELRIPRLVPKKVLARVSSEEMEAGASLYDLAQIVSNVGRDLSFRKRLYFENLAGKLLNFNIGIPAS